MASLSEDLREVCAKHAAEERALVPEIELLTDGELWEFLTRMDRAGFLPPEPDGFRALHPAVKAERQGNGANPLQINLQSAFMLAFRENAYRQMQGC
jgi:hypothetical protein